MKKLKTLVVYKRSSLSVAGKWASRLGKVKRFQDNHTAHFATLRAIEKVLTANGIPYDKRSRGPRVDFTAYDLVITVGGDGTVLEAARSLANHQMILAVNSDPAWSVGQFCSADVTTFEMLLKKYLCGKAQLRRLYKLKLVIKGEATSRQIECLNDILICHTNPAAMSRYTITIGGEEEDQRDSGIWISTAAGSTGAMASAGGLAMPLDSTALQYKPRELYHGRGVRQQLSGGLVAKPGKIIITSMMPRGVIFVDGSHIKLPFTYGHRAEISSSKNFVQLVHA